MGGNEGGLSGAGGPIVAAIGGEARDGGGSRGATRG